MHHHPDTIFVHGAIDRLTMKFVPSLDTKFELPTSPPPPLVAPHMANPSNGRMIEDVHEWVRALNDYLHRGLEDYAARPGWNAERTSRGGEAVLTIQCRPAVWGRSVVCNSYADGGVVATAAAADRRRRALRAVAEAGDPRAFEGIASDALDPAPAAWLRRHGVRRVVVGHKPTGDCPAVLSSAYTGVEIVAVDTSFSDRKDLDAGADKKFGDNRGQAIAMVEIAGENSSQNWLETFGVLACGTEYFNRYPILGDAPDRDIGDPHLGRRLSDGWWVKARSGLTQDGHYHLCRGSGRNIEYDVRPVQDVVDAIHRSQ